MGITQPTVLMDEVAALDDLAKFASRTIHFDEAADMYVVTDKTGNVIGHHPTYRDARAA